MHTHRSSTVPLAGAYLVLIVYASLYPFSGWAWPAGSSLGALLHLPWPRGHDRFDLIANLLGYVPLGSLLYLAVVRSGGRWAVALVMAVIMPSWASWWLEAAQNFVPGRVPSGLDWTLNTAGGALGALLTGVAHWLGAVRRWQSLRDQWFIRNSAGGLVLLVLWPLGLLFPAPLPLGMGQIWPHLRAALEWLGASPDWLAQWLGDAGAMANTVDGPLSLGAECVGVVAGLLTPCLVAFAVSRPGWRRLVLAVVGAGLAFGVTTLSAAMNFGPPHALSWTTAATLPAWLGAVVLASALAWAPRRLHAALALVTITVMLSVVAQAPTDPYFAESLQAWEGGRFIRFHGIAQWVGWLWPYAAMLWLVTRLAQRDAEPRAKGSLPPPSSTQAPLSTIEG